MTLRTTIGERLKESHFRLVTAGFAAVAVLLTDFIGALLKPGYGKERLALPLVACLTYLVLARGDLGTVGLRLAPIQGWRYWVKATMILGAIMALLILASIGICRLLGLSLADSRTGPSEIVSELLHACVVAPLVEEAVYRLVLCTAAAAILGPWWTVLLSGVAFGALHVLYGNPGPDNLIAGFVLGWAYLKSGTITVPLALHSLGNLCAVLAHVAAWYWA